MPIGGGRLLPAPGRELPDYTVFTLPDANLADAASEEIELDQALSLAGRFGRMFLGCLVTDWYNEFRDEYLTIASADFDADVQWNIATRTGAFTFADPEKLWQWRLAFVAAAHGTAANMTRMDLMEADPGNDALGEPELYVAPRLFFRTTNALDATISADAMSARMSSISRRLTFQAFVELLERFADVTLL